MIFALRPAHGWPPTAQTVRGVQAKSLGAAVKSLLERDSALWLERMAERGWTVPTWPTQYGGAGLDKNSTQS